MAYNWNKTPQDLKVEIDEKQYAVDVYDVPELFKTAWNDAVTALYPATMIGTEFVHDEWFWATGPLIVSCRQAFSAAVREQFDEDGERTVNYQGDQEDGDHTYYCVGVVWHSVKRKFASKDRICNCIQRLFVSKQEAQLKGLPVSEVNAR